MSITEILQKMYSNTFFRWGKSCLQQTHPTEQLSLWSEIPDTDRCCDKWDCIIISCSIKTLSSHCKTTYFHSKTCSGKEGTALKWVSPGQAALGDWVVVKAQPDVFKSVHLIWPHSPQQPRQAQPSPSDWHADTWTPPLPAGQHAAWAHLLATHTAMQTFQQLGRL